MLIEFSLILKFCYNSEETRIQKLILILCFKVLSNKKNLRYKQMEIFHQSFQMNIHHQISLILLNSFYIYNLCTNHFFSWKLKNVVILCVCMDEIREKHFRSFTIVPTFVQSWCVLVLGEIGIQRDWKGTMFLIRLTTGIWTINKFFNI